jgi:periplasmic copper chaperone A
MTATHLRRQVLLSGAAAGLSLALPWRGAQACELITKHLRVTHPWTRATAHGATSAVLCMKFDEVTETDILVLVETPIARAAQMAGPGAEPRVHFEIAQGQETYLAERGTHVLLTGLDFSLETGRSYPLRLGFQKGGVYDTVLSVDYGRFV